MAPVVESRFDPNRIENPFSSRYMTQKQVDAFAREIAQYKGLEKYEKTFVKAGRILQHGWQSMRPDSSDGDAAVDDVHEVLSPKELDDLERDEHEARRLKDIQPPWKLGFWMRSRSGKREEIPHSIFWNQPKELRTTIITLCVAAIVQGWNQTATNGANLTWAHALGLTHDDSCDLHGRAKWAFAAVNAAPYLAASVFAVVLSDPLNEVFFGRRSAICVSAVFILASSIGGAFAQNTWQFLVCRILLGIGMGCKASVVPVFAAEVAPARIRGSLVMNWQLFDALGIFLGFTANLIVSPVGATSWRAMTASSVIPTTILLALAIVACPESPRFLVSRGYYGKAFETLSRLRGSRLLAARELLYTYRQLYEELRISRQTKGVVSVQTANPTDAGSRAREQGSAERGSAVRGSLSENRPNFFQKLWQLFAMPRVRNATITAVVCMIGQQLCGVNVLIFFSSTIFSDATGQQCGSQVTPASLLKPLFMSWGLGLVNLVFGLPAYWLIDRLGRRWLLLATLPFMTVFIGAAGLSYAGGAHNVVLGIFTYLFMVFYSVGMGPVPFTISSEVFPLDHRIAGMSVAVFANLFGAGLLALFTPVLTASAIGHAGLLGVFTLLNLVTFVLVFLFVRETAGTIDADNPDTMTALALEELWRIFAIPLRTFMKYQVKETLPWWWNYSIWKARSLWLCSNKDVKEQRGSEKPVAPMPVHIWADMEAIELQMPVQVNAQSKDQ